jgi:hypothetical protein
MEAYQKYGTNANHLDLRKVQSFQLERTLVKRAEAEESKEEFS